jgi:hypothetical protein
VEVHRAGHADASTTVTCGSSLYPARVFQRALVPTRRSNPP